jgi:hypothetical protein
MAFKPEKDKKLRHVLNRWKRFVIEGNGKESGAGPSTAGSHVATPSEFIGKTHEEVSSAPVPSGPLVGQSEHVGTQK